MFAAVADTPYNIVLVLHIVAVIAALAPAFAHPFLGAQSKRLDKTGQQLMLGFLASNSQRIYAPALIVAGLLGFGLSGMSDGVFEMSQGWLIGAVIVWLAMNGVLHAVLIPAEKAMASGIESAEARVTAGGGIISILAIVMLVLMVFKPGL